MARRKTGSRAAGTPATRELTARGVPFTLHPYEHDPAAPSFGREAAEALGVDPASVFKTLLAVSADGLVVGVVPVSSRLDLKALAAAVGAKRLEMADAVVAERVTGYVVGGISPVGQRRRLPTVVDESASGWDLVYVSGGRRGLDLAVSPADLVAVTGAALARIAR